MLIGVGLFFFGSADEEVTKERPPDLPAKKVAKRPVHHDPEKLKPRAAQSPTSASIRKEFENPALKKDLTDKQIQQLDANVEKLEKRWDSRLKNLFLNKMSLSLQDFADYQVMRDGFEDDRLEAFERFHKEMAQKHGNSYRYSPTLEMKEYEQKIKTEYRDLFRKRFGEENYARYMGELESFNDQARKEADPALGVLYIEY